MKGIILKKKFLLILSFVAIAVTLFFVYPIFSITSSPYSIFNVTPDIVFLNWTNGYVNNISIGVSAGFNSVNFTIFNSTILVANYSQANTQTACNGYTFLVKNATGFFNTAVGINEGSITNVSLVDVGHLICAPGRYSKNTFRINATNTTGTNTENANIMVVTDIPISSNSRGVETFSGSLPGNATTYQSFYFNTSFNSSVFGKATAVAVNLTGYPSSQLAQIFLFDNNSVMKAKSINTNTSQYLSYYPLPTPFSDSSMWEIRVYGNSTLAIPYNGFLIYSTLNVTSTANNTVSNLDYGNMNVSSTNSTSLYLINQGSLNLQNIVLSSSIYRMQQFSESGTKSFSFLVGDSNVESKVRVELHWTGNSNYTLNVYNPTGSLVMTSSNFYTLANATNATSQELYNETTSIVPGYWNASIVSNSGNDNFNLNISTFQTNNSIISSNISATSLNSLSSVAAQVNLSIPTLAIDGMYGGSILLTDSNGGRVTIPVSFNVTTPTLLVLNATYSPTTMNPFSSGTFRQDENYGASLTRTINFNISNIGSFDQVIDASLNSTNLTCSSCGFKSTMTSDITSITYIPAHSSALFQVNITYNNSFPVNTYFGWIFINATNTTITSNSHPYSSYNLTLELNLTNSVMVKVGQIFTNQLNNFAGTGGENVTQSFNIYYVNGTEITNLNVSNFTSIWLQEKNISSLMPTLGRIPASDSLNLSNGTNPIYCESGCVPWTTSAYNINFTLPASQPGGQYAVYSSIAFNGSGGSTFTGQGVNSSTLIINNTGLLMSTNTSGVGCSFDQTCSGSTSMSPNGTLIVYAKVANYGPLNASAATINYTTSCTGYTVAQGINSGCGSVSYSTTNKTWTLNVLAYTTSCTVSWNLTAGSSSAGSPSCAAAYLMGGGATWFDSSGVNLTITVSNVTASSSTGNTNNPNLPGTSAAVYVSITNYPTIVYVVQNSTNSTVITAKNVNNTLTQDIGLSIRNLTSSWYSISPSLQTAVVPFNSTNFTITFNIPASAAVADYLTNLTASTNYGSKSQLFTLRVLPSENTKLLINQTYQLALMNYTNLIAQVNQSKSTMNTTQVEADLAAAKTKLDQVQSYINLGDYFSAQQSLNAAQSFLIAAETDLKNLNQNPYSDIFSLLQANLLYIALGAIAIAAMFIAYLFWPTKSETSLDSLLKPKAKVNPQESMWDKLKNKWSWENLKNKWKKST